ncbi:serum opacification factor [Streptococcus pyogenes]|uniref:serum opacification factor n=2 Tax=Streptococcus pyogenes TaxID=1314 RepID=UPI00109CD470|nr:serum opacification factor [Streptococcus pyogenes]VGU29587.1 Fibronectin-binding protein [Streptococcus pyogenes]HEQ4636262.1 fibronectin binding protein [Streptococcus pyogenes]HER5305140.1 fibronectin binding protein [Streptococcus pyogenes]HER5323194.1 fibronectin binding protein [Streptococcus pyogenes]HER5348865.1 fibronectin binding protein [Streptococcus pyogenes]
MTNCKYKLRKLSVGLVSVGTMLIAPTVLGQEVSASTTSTETSAASAGVGTSGTAASETGSGAAVATATTTTATTNGGPQSTPAVAEATPQPQAQIAPVAAATSTSSASSSSDGKAPQAVTSSTSPSTPAAASSNGSNQEASAETEPQTMEVEKYTVDKENSKLNIKDGKTPKTGSSVNNEKDTKLIRNRDGKQRDIVDVTRTVKTNEDGTIDVTVTVKPKQIDEGADVMALLDVSKKMSEDDFNNAKNKIKKLVKTLTSKSASNSDNDEHKYNSRNSVRLMTFYREISNPIDISGKTEEQLDKLLDDLRKKAKANYDWGVDLQGAIHKAREIFNKEKEKKFGKRQHIVLFSQGESTFSYELQNSVKEDKTKLSRLSGAVTSSNPLLPWPPIFNHTHKNIDMLDDVKNLVKLGQTLGIAGLDNLQSTLSLISTGSSLAGAFLGGGSLTEYLTLKEYKSGDLKENQFDYTKRVGEGYHFHSFSERKKTGEIPFKSEIEPKIKELFENNKNNQDKSWTEWIFDKLSLTERIQKAKQETLMKLLEYLFYKREYHYYNHNLSAIAEAKMAQQEGITFYSVDVTDLKTTSKRVKRQVESKEDKKKEKDREDIEKERNEKFDNYLKQMSEGGKDFFEDVDKAEEFKDILTNVTVTETFEDGVNVKDNSWQVSSENNNSLHSNYKSVTHKAASDASWWSLYSNKESLTWTISKEQLKEAFEKNSSLTFKYKLQVNKQKLLDKNKNRTKRDTSTENKTSVTKDIISNTVNYKINNQEVKGNKLDDVKLTYTKETVPVPDVEGEVVPIPEKPLVEPMTPLYPAIPNYPTPDIPTPQLPKDEDLEISGGHGPIVDIVEDTGTGVEGGAQNGVVSTQENKDPIVDITEDTQPGMSGSNDATVVEEDTAPKRPDVLVGGQSDPIDITEDTQPGMSGSNDATVVEEDTAPKRPDVLVGGQSDPIDITEDTQPGMSGSNDATVIEEDTKPKRFFHFDNEPQAPEKPKEQPSLSLPQAPVYKAAHHLPASGDKREASFTIAALTIIGAAGLLSKKRRDTEEN